VVKQDLEDGCASAISWKKLQYETYSAGPSGFS